jgi:UDP-N-acetyl-D-galactosamine dehydrogenase
MKDKICVVGLGYVGLPLAVEFAKQYEVIGYDINKKRVSQLKKSIDVTNEVTSKELKEIKKLKYTDNQTDISKCNIYILTVPTPINEDLQPDLTILCSATTMVSKYLKKGDYVIYESTVYPGCTEEICVPLLEKGSRLKLNTDFFCGYSPERINPGDKINTLTKILKITSGSNKVSSKRVNDLYKSIITAGTYMAPSIKVAEAAKAIENAQRDLNISFMNEIALMFNKMNISTNEVIKAASTKWNFLNFSPGLVGGHCIGVDPYYLVYKSKKVGYIPKVILSGRDVNQLIPIFIAEESIKLLIKRKINIHTTRALIMGFTFKENCSDIRNTKVFDIYKTLNSYDIKVDIYDPIAINDEVKNEYGIDLIKNIKLKYDLIICAVSHNVFDQIDINKYRKSKSVLFDVKGKLNNSDIRL